MKQQALPHFAFQPLTYIRQTGTHTHPNGAVTYTFLASVRKDWPPVMITMMVTGGGEVQVQARFDETIRSLTPGAAPQLEG